MSWTLINLLTAPQPYREQVMGEIASLRVKHGMYASSMPGENASVMLRLGDDFTRDAAVVMEQMPLTDAFIQESLRLVQQSLTLRKVLNPVVLETERGVLHVPAGTTIATLLSITNLDEHALPPSPALLDFHSERYEVVVL